MIIIEVRATRGEQRGAKGYGKADIVHGKSIRLYGTRWPNTVAEQAYDLTFKVGDHAEYDSYNYSYLGVISHITEKSVTIVKDRGCLMRPNFCRLQIFDFEWRNWDFDLAVTRQANADVSQHI